MPSRLRLISAMMLKRSPLLALAIMPNWLLSNRRRSVLFSKLNCGRKSKLITNVCLWSPVENAQSRRRLLANEIPSRTNFLKFAASAVMRYVPSGRSRNRNTPFSSVVTERLPPYTLKKILKTRVIAQGCESRTNIHAQCQSG